MDGFRNVGEGGGGGGGGNVGRHSKSVFLIYKGLISGNRYPAGNLGGWA